MKRYILSALTLLMAASVVAPAAQALDTKGLGRQVSTPAEISEDATFHDLIRHNRRARNKS